MSEIAPNLTGTMVKGGRVVLSFDPNEVVSQSDKGNDKITHANWVDLGCLDPSLEGMEICMVVIRKVKKVKSKPAAAPPATKPSAVSTATKTTGRVAIRQTASDYEEDLEEDPQATPVRRPAQRVGARK